jgi:YgiT-type zinc finger domain-containing protein
MKSDNGKDTDLTCSVCGAQTARIVRRPQLVGKGANLVIVENVPMYSCRNCGHTYLTIEVARMLDQFRLHPDRGTEIREIPVAEFARSDNR